MHWSSQLWHESIWTPFMEKGNRVHVSGIVCSVSTAPISVLVFSFLDPANNIWLFKSTRQEGKCIWKRKHIHPAPLRLFIAQTLNPVYILQRGSSKLLMRKDNLPTNGTKPGPCAMLRVSIFTKNDDAFLPIYNAILTWSTPFFKFKVSRLFCECPGQNF